MVQIHGLKYFISQGINKRLFKVDQVGKVASLVCKLVTLAAWDGPDQSVAISLSMSHASISAWIEPGQMGTRFNP